MTLSRRVRPILVVAALAAGAVALLAPIPWRGRAAVAFQDLAHVPLGATVALLLHSLAPAGWPARRRLGFAFVGAALFLAGMEALQRPPSRNASLADALAGLAGAAGALALGPARTGRGAKARWGAVAGVALLVAPTILPVGTLIDLERMSLEFPSLSSLESPLEWGRWHLGEARGERVQEHATEGTWALRVDLEAGVYPGATLTPVEDWRGYATLALDVTLDGDTPYPMTLKVCDEAHRGEYSDRFHAALDLRPGPNAVRVPLEAIARAPRTRVMDLAHVACVQLFAVRPGAPRRITIDHVRLEP